MARIKVDVTDDVKLSVGDGVTYHIGTDRYSYTVISVSPSGKKAVIQADSFTMNKAGDWFGNQIWDITPNPNGEKMTITLTAKKVGDKVVTRWGNVSKGRSVYQDPHF